MAEQEKPATTPESGKSTAVVEREVTVTPEKQVKAEKTTGQRIFPDFIGSKVPGADYLGVPEKKSEPAKKQDVAEGEPKAEAKPEPKYLNPEDFKGAKLKLKIDGVEEEATLEDVIRRAQLDKHLTNKGQKLSEEEKRIKSKEMALLEQERLLSEMLKQSKPSEKPVDEESIVKDDPYVRRIESELKQTREIVHALQAQAQPMLLKAAIERVASQVKETLGFDDFTSYQGKIGDYLKSLPTPQAQAIDNESGWLAIYKDLKLQELMKQAAAPKEEPKTVERPAPRTVPVESGKSATTGVNDDNASKLRSLFEKARRLSNEGSDARHSAWEEYLKARDGREIE